jgi:hypothetical protein
MNVTEEQKEKKKSYYQRNREKRLAQMRAYNPGYYQRNKDELKFKIKLRRCLGNDEIKRRGHARSSEAVQ